MLKDSYRYIMNYVRNSIKSPEIKQSKIKKYIKRNNGMPKDRMLVADYSIALVVPCYMHEKYVEKTFLSIVNQTKKPDEIIFINDCSPDETLTVLEKCVSRYADTEPEFIKRVKILSNSKNIGQAASLNYAINTSNSNLIMILNDDDYLFHDAIEVMVELFKKYNYLYMIGATHIPFNDDSLLNVNSKSILEFYSIDDIKLTIHNPENVFNYINYDDLNMTHSSCTFKKKAWEVVGGYYSNKKERIVPFSDRDFQIRVNCFFPVGVSYNIPFSFWRSKSSVDAGINS